MRGISTLGRGKGGGPDESPLRGALGPDVWYPTIPGSLEEKRPRVSNTTPKGGGGEELLFLTA